MGKKGGADSNKEQAPAKASSAPKKDEVKGKSGKNTPEDAPEGALAKLRPKPRVFFFCIFVGFCAWLTAFHDNCNVQGKKKKDCGYSGISPMECRTYACFLKGGGDLLKKTVKLEPKGEAVGLRVAEEKESSWVTVTAVVEGAAKEYNDKADAEDRILPGDNIIKVNSQSGAEKMIKALEGKGDKAMELEIRRSKLPSYLKWIRSGGKPGSLEKFLTSPGTERWSRSFSYVGGVGLMCWFLSGYPPTSLPVYYFGLSGVTSFWLARCCLDEDVPAGQPHCYKGKSPKFEVAVAEAWTKTSDLAVKTFAKIKKDPKAYFKSWIDIKF